MNRTQLTLGGVLLLQVLVILLVRSPFADASAGWEARALLPGLEQAVVARLEVRGTENSKVTLLRVGEEWSVQELDGFPADGEKIAGLIDDLVGVEVRRPVVSTSRYHESFEVEDDDNQARVLLWDEGDEKQVDLILGSSPNFGLTHARLAGEAEVYEIRGLAPYDVRSDGDAWIDKSLVSLDADALSYFGLTNEAGSFELEKTDGAWKVVAPAEAAGELDATKLDDLMRSMALIRLDKSAGPTDDSAHGFANPAATLVMRWGAGAETSDTSEVTVLVGNRPADEESQRFITRSDFGFAGTIWEGSVKKLLEETLDGLYVTANPSS